MNPFQFIKSQWAAWKYSRKFEYKEAWAWMGTRDGRHDLYWAKLSSSKKGLLDLLKEGETSRGYILKGYPVKVEIKWRRFK